METTDTEENPQDETGSAGSTGLAGSNGEVVLNRVRVWLGRFVCVMNDSDLDLLTLWIAHTHLVEETYTSPRLLIESPVPSSGKTTVLEHLERLCVNPVQMATVSSPALITRMLDKGMRTILIDEADRSLRPDKPGVEDLIAVLNSGYKKGATRPVLVPTKGGGWDSVEMPTFSPVAMAGNQPKLPDDTMSRTIRVLLMPDHDNSVEDSDWELIEDEAVNIAGELAQWVDSQRLTVRDGPRPTLHEEARARTKERWMPLKRVAVAAGGRWPEVVDRLVDLDLERQRLEREEGLLNEKPHVILLRNIAEVWPADEPFQTAEGLIYELKTRFENAWGANDMYKKGLTPQRLGRMLVNNYGVHSERMSDKTRGYTAISFTNALKSVRLPPLFEPAEPVEPAEPAESWDSQPPCSGCGGAMASPISIERGYCSRPDCVTAFLREQEMVK